MFKKVVATATLAAAVVAGAPTSAYAQSYYGDRWGYEQDSGYGSRYSDDARERAYRRAQDYRRYEAQRRAEYARQQANWGQGYYDEGSARSYPVRRRHAGYQCHSGTTGGVLGAIVGGLLGREIGRGGAYNRPSTTGAIIGAGAGALAGRAIGRSGNDC